jgi:hypothetical protein
MKTTYQVTYSGGRVVTQKLTGKQISSQLVNTGKISIAGIKPTQNRGQI